MNKFQDWKKRIVSPQAVINQIKPGMNIFLGTGVAEPLTLVKHLLTSDATNLQDLDLIQLVSFGDAISFEPLTTNKYRLKTFYSGWVASEAVDAGRVDLIPSRFACIPQLIESGRIPIDVTFVQITPPNEAGYCSLGVAVDTARIAMDKASLRVGEINPAIPFTYGDTFVPVSEFDMLVEATEAPLYFERWPKNEIFDRIADHIATFIENGSCLAFSIGPLFESLSRALMGKHDLGIHSPFFTDALMDLVRSGAVTNRFKEIFRGKSVASYGFGSKELMAWLNRNPLVEFQGIDKVFNPIHMGQNPRFISVLTARKVDLSGRIALPHGRMSVTGPAEAVSFFNASELSKGGKTIFALPSRNLKGKSNIMVSVLGYPNLFGLREAVDTVITEYGDANLMGRSIRERAQALIDIAHPDDRAELVEQAKAARILYKDQIFIAQSGHLYPNEINTTETFNNIEIRFRAIKPSDEEEMRRLFYRFSDEAVYYRYFTAVKAMPHSKMQEYVNVDYHHTMSIVGLEGDPGKGRIIAEARYVRLPNQPYADVAFVVDEQYQGLGIASFMLKMLVRLARERCLKGFTADVLATNKGMLKVFEKSGEVVKSRLEQGVYTLTIPFSNTTD